MVVVLRERFLTVVTSDLPRSVVPRYAGIAWSVSCSRESVSSETVPAQHLPSPTTPGARTGSYICTESSHHFDKWRNHLRRDSVQNEERRVVRCAVTGTELFSMSYEQGQPRRTSDETSLAITSDTNVSMRDFRQLTIRIRVTSKFDVGEASALIQKENRPAGSACCRLVWRSAKGVPHNDPYHRRRRTRARPRVGPIHPPKSVARRRF